MDAATTKFNTKNAAVKRILQEIKELKKDSPEEFIAEALEDDIFEWHFVLRGPPGTEFEGGLYHGRILLPFEYPLKPPAFLLLTPSGRFEVGVKVCLSISNHHPELWRPSWGVRTALLALAAHMPIPAGGALGALDFPKEDRRNLASRSAHCPPSFGGPSRQRLINEMHAAMLKKMEQPQPPTSQQRLQVDTIQEKQQKSIDAVLQNEGHQEQPIGMQPQQQKDLQPMIKDWQWVEGEAVQEGKKEEEIRFAAQGDCVAASNPVGGEAVEGCLRRADSALSYEALTGRAYSETDVFTARGNSSLEKSSTSSATAACAVTSARSESENETLEAASVLSTTTDCHGVLLSEGDVTVIGRTSHLTWTTSKTSSPSMSSLSSQPLMDLARDELRLGSNPLDLNSATMAFRQEADVSSSTTATPAQETPAGFRPLTSGQAAEQLSETRGSRSVSGSQPAAGLSQEECCDVEPTNRPYSGRNNESASTGPPPAPSTSPLLFENASGFPPDSFPGHPSTSRLDHSLHPTASSRAPSPFPPSSSPDSNDIAEAEGSRRRRREAAATATTRPELGIGAPDAAAGDDANAAAVQGVRVGRTRDGHGASVSLSISLSPSFVDRMLTTMIWVTCVCMALILARRFFVQLSFESDASPSSSSSSPAMSSSMR